MYFRLNAKGWLTEASLIVEWLVTFRMIHSRSITFQSVAFTLKGLQEAFQRPFTVNATPIIARSIPISQIMSKSNIINSPSLGWRPFTVNATPIIEAFHGKRDTFERDIIIGGLLSFSPIVIFVVWIYKSASPTDYFSHANTIKATGWLTEV
jgi:hypothetical protein